MSKQPINILKIILTFTIFLLFLSGISFAQEEEPAMLIFSGRVEAKDLVTGRKGDKLNGVKVEIYKNGKLYKTVQTSAGGKYQVETELGANYKVKFVTGGYVSKFVTINTRGADTEEDRSDQTMIVDMTLFKDVPGVDFSLLDKNAIGVANFNTESQEPEWDMAYISRMKGQIQALVDRATKKEEELEKEFQDAVKRGDSDVSSKKYETAISSYEKALKIRPDDSSVKTKLENAKKKQEEFAAEAEKDKKYQEFIDKAKQAFNEKDYAFAKKNYTDALGVKPSERMPKDKIAEIDRIIAKNVANEQKYNEFISKGDGSFSGKNYDDAITNYEGALSVRPGDQVATDKLAKAKAEKQKQDDLANAEKEKRTQYDKLIAQAEQEFKAEKYENSKKNFQDALNLYPDESMPKQRIDDIDEILKNLAAKADKRKKYDELIAKADGQFNSEDLENAKVTYQQSLALFANEKHPNDRIALIDKKLSEKAADAEKKAKYDALIAQADSQFGSEDYATAKGNYEAALKLYPTEQHPTSRLQEIANKLKDLAAEEAKRKKFDALIAKADQQFTAKTYEISKASYQQALALYANEAHPKARITEIDKLLGDLAAQKEAEAAEAAKRKQYDDLIKKADGQFTGKSYEDSKSNYNQALALYPGETHPTNRIAEIDKLLAQQEKDNEQKAIDDKYNALIAQADSKYKTGQSDKNNSAVWEEAKAKYKAAFEVKSNQYPQDQIDKINAELERISKEVDMKKQYDKIIKVADTKFIAKNYEEAKGLYERALKLNPSDPHPKNRIAEIDKLIAEQKKNSDQKAIDDKYNALIAQADTKFKAAQNDKNNVALWKEAQTKYNAALNVKEDSYPHSQLDKIDDELARITKETDLEKQYQKILKVADDKFASKDYVNSKTLYERATKFKANDQYPKDQIKEIDRLLEEQRKKMDADAIEKEYNALLAKADQQFIAKDLEASKSNYKAASNLKSNEQYPKDQIKEIDELLALAAKNRIYNEIIKEANKNFDAKDYNKAKANYEKALTHKPGESYPKDRLREIEMLLKTLNRLAESTTETDDGYTAALDNANNAFSNKSYENALANYKKALGIRPDQAFPKRRIKEIEDILAAMRNVVTEPTGELTTTPVDRVPTTIEPKVVKVPVDDESRFGTIVNDLSLGETMFQLQKGLDDIDAQKYKDVGVYEDERDAFNQGNIKEQTEIIFENRDQLKEFTEIVIDNHEAGDQKRRENEDEVLEIHDERKTFIDENVDKNREARYANAEMINENWEKRLDNYEEYKEGEDESIDVVIKKNDEIIENIDNKNKESLEDIYANKELIDENWEARLDNYEEYKEGEDESIDEVIKKNDEIIENIDNKNKESLEDIYANKELIDENWQARLDNYEEYKEGEDESIDEVIKKNDEIIENIDNKNKESLEDIYANKELIDENWQARLDNYEEYKEGEDESIDEVIKKNDEIIENIDNKNKESLEDIYANKELIDENWEKRLDNYEEYKEGEDESIDEVIKKNDEIIENIDNKNKESLEDIYANKELIDENWEKRLDNYEEYKEGEDESIDEVVKKNDEIIDNIDNKSKESIEKIFENAENIELIKHMKPYHFTPEYQNEIAVKYGQGVTQKIYKKSDTRGNVVEVNVVRYVVNGNIGHQYVMTRNRFGESYSKDGGSISETMWETETSIVSVVEETN